MVVTVLSRRTLRRSIVPVAAILLVLWGGAGLFASLSTTCHVGTAARQAQFTAVSSVPRGDGRAVDQASAAHDSVTDVQASGGNPWLTSQACHELADGMSELCTYEGPICFDAENYNFYLSVPTASRYGRDLRSGGSVDPRTMRPKLALVGGKQRDYSLPNLPEAAYTDPTAWAAGGAAFGTLDPTRDGRMWGAENSISLRELSWELIASSTTPQDAGRLGPTWIAAATAARPASELPAATFTDFELGGENVGSGPALASLSRVTWLLPERHGAGPTAHQHGATWIVDLGHGGLNHIFHFAAPAFALWAGKRLNATEKPYRPALPGRRLSMHYGSAVLPGIDAVLLAGKYNRNGVGAEAVTGIESPNIISWTRETLRLLTQRHTRVLFNGNLRTDADLRVEPPSAASAASQQTAPHLVCVPRAVIGTGNPRIFASAGDAFSYRLLAYAAANVTTEAVPEHPPRRIGVLQRSTRGLYNTSALEALVRSTGLDWGYVRTDGSWADQVRAFAGVGVLIAVHGAALMNTMFMPHGAVVIEIFPPFYRPSMYGELARVSGLTYYGVTTPRPRNPADLPDTHETRSTGWAFASTPEYIAKCDSDTAHPSSLDAAWFGGPCGAGKDMFADVSYDALAVIVRQALDDIGCRDSICSRRVGGPYDDMRKRAP